MDDTENKLTKQDMLERMEELRINMLSVGVDMEYFSGFNGSMAEKAKELLGASVVLQTWMKGIEKEALESCH
jgi:hypothetical protein